MKKEKSCGIALFNNDKILLVHQNGGNWSLPKGHVEDNETEFETAIRETKEETNVDARIIDGFRKVITYSPKENVIKDVVFFVGKPTSNEIVKQDTEIQEVRYVTLNEALELVNNYPDLKEVIKEAFDYYNKINN